MIHDQIRLRNILDNSYKCDSNSIDILHYTHDIIEQKKLLSISSVANTHKNSALNRAFNSGNQRCINILFEYMAKIQRNGS